MKTLKTVILLILPAVLTLTSCDRHPDRDSRLFRWCSVDSTFDSTVESLERTYITPTPTNVRDSLTRKLESSELSATARAQSLYWQARLERSLGNQRQACLLADSGLAAIDSSANPYEWSRLLQIKAALKTTPARDAYEISAQNLRFYEQTADSFMIGSTLMRLGAVMWSISDTLPAKNYYLRADTVFSRLGIEEYRIKNLVNLANIYDRPATAARRDSIMDFLLESKMAQADSQLYLSVLRNAYLNTGDESYLRRALKYTGTGQTDTETRAAFEGMLADHYLGNDYPFDSIATYARKAFAGINRVSDHYSRATIFNSMAFTSYATGNTDSAIEFYRAFLDERLQIADEQYSLETTKADYRNIFDRARREEQMRHARERALLMASLTLAVALIIATAAVLYFRTKRAHIRRQYAEVQLQQNRNYLSACALSIDEKDRIIGSIVRTVNNMEQAGKLSVAQAREITANIRSSLSNNIERETFTELHKKLHPEFMRRLKKDFPNLTESQLKHAAYIAMGMTSKQIAQALNIEYDSVKKSRTRLRSRMGLKKETSLEDTLRDYASTQEI